MLRIVITVTILIAEINLNYGKDVSERSTTEQSYYQLNPLQSSYHFGYEVGPDGHFHHERRGQDGVTYGCYGHVDPNGKLHVTHYVADSRGYRVVQPNKPVLIFLEDDYDSGQRKTVRPWTAIFLPRGCGRYGASESTDPPEIIYRPPGVVSTTVRPSSSTTRRTTTTFRTKPTSRPPWTTRLPNSTPVVLTPDPPVQSTLKPSRPPTQSSTTWRPASTLSTTKYPTTTRHPSSTTTRFSTISTSYPSSSTTRYPMTSSERPKPTTSYTTSPVTTTVRPSWTSTTRRTTTTHITSSSTTGRPETPRPPDTTPVILTPDPPVFSTSKPPRPPTYSTTTTRRPPTTTRKPSMTTRYPSSTTKRPPSTTRYPASTTKHPVTGYPTPSTTRSTTRQPFTTTKKPPQTTSYPSSTTRRPITSSSKPTHTTSQTMKPPVFVTSTVPPRPSSTRSTTTRPITSSSPQPPTTTDDPSGLHLNLTIPKPTNRPGTGPLPTPIPSQPATPPNCPTPPVYYFVPYQHPAPSGVPSFPCGNCTSNRGYLGLAPVIYIPNELAHRYGLNPIRRGAIININTKPTTTTTRRPPVTTTVKPPASNQCPSPRVYYYVPYPYSAPASVPSVPCFGCRSNRGYLGLAPVIYVPNELAPLLGLHPDERGISGGRWLLD